MQWFGWLVAFVVVGLPCVLLAILFFMLNLIGRGLGPVLTGLIADLWEPQYGSDSIRYAMSVTILINL